MAHAIVIGAGMSGTCAARTLVDAGWSVTVLDKGRRHGGRLATRTVGDAVFDTGALDFATSDDARTMQLVVAWRSRGLIVTTDAADSNDELPPPLATRWRGTPTMRSLPSALAAELDVRLETTVTDLRVMSDATGVHWDVTAQDGSGQTRHRADALVLTTPAPQVMTLLDADDGTMHRTKPLVAPCTVAALRSVTYAPSLTVLAVPEAPAADAPFTSGPARGPRGREVSGAHAAPDVARVHDDRASGASPVPAFTLQATANFSAAHLDADRDDAAAILAHQASAMLGTPLRVVHVHGWRYAQVTAGIGAEALRDDSSGAPVVIAGDAFGWSDASVTEGVERAARSGLSAAALLTD